MCCVFKQLKGPACHVRYSELGADNGTFVADEHIQQSDQTDTSSKLPGSSTVDTEDNDMKLHDLIQSCPVFEHFPDVDHTASRSAGNLVRIPQQHIVEHSISNIHDWKTNMFTSLKPHGKEALQGVGDLVMDQEMNTQTNCNTNEWSSFIITINSKSPCLKTQSNGGERYECELCSQTFSDRSNLRKHKRIHVGDKRYTCDMCHASFTQKVTLISHIRTHTGVKPFPCNVCQKRFRFSSSLSKHKRLHSDDGGKLYDEVSKQCLCNFCGKTFANMTSLTRHCRTHTGQRPYVCHICDMTFADPSQLVPHIRIHINSRPFVCEVCSRAFRQSGTLRRHLITHTDKRPYMCNVCGKSFSRSNHLKTHNVTHTNERAFVCNICDKAFSQSGHLKTHTHTHTNEQPFVCNLCDKAFKQLSSLRKHRLNLHF